MLLQFLPKDRAHARPDLGPGDAPGNHAARRRGRAWVTGQA
jgi:hypothetical protein